MFPAIEIYGVFRWIGNKILPCFDILKLKIGPLKAEILYLLQTLTISLKKNASSNKKKIKKKCDKSHGTQAYCYNFFVTSSGPWNFGKNCVKPLFLKNIYIYKYM